MYILECWCSSINAASMPLEAMSRYREPQLQVGDYYALQPCNVILTAHWKSKNIYNGRRLIIGCQVKRKTIRNDLKFKKPLGSRGLYRNISAL